MKKIPCLMMLMLLQAACVPPDQNATRQSGASRTSAAAPILKEETAASEGGIGRIPEDATPIKVGILLPLSGDAAALGSAMLDAATLALYDEYMSVPSNRIRSQIILIPKDTGNSANSAAQAAQQAINDGATFIVGPLFSQAVTAMKPIVKAAGIPVISFSNNRVVAEPNIYTYGYLPEQQIARISEYAYLHGYQRVALLAPNDAYGQKVQDGLSATYSQKGGFVSPSELYAPSEINIDAAVARMMATYQNSADERKFQAVFIADSGSSMKSIIRALRKNNFDFAKIKLLGAGLWDDPELTKIPELHGAIFPGTPAETFQRFNERFMAMYGYKPMRLASLSYDAVSLIARLSMSSPSAKIDASKIPVPEGYHAPANNLYRLMPDGTSERKLAILEVTPAGFKVVDPATKSFLEAGQ